MKKLIIVALAIILCFFSSIPSNIIVSAEVASKTSEKGYVSHADKVDSYQLDDPTKLSTNELIDVLLDYPYFMDVFAYDSYSQGLQKIIRTFNGAKELFDRDNIGTALLIKYSTSDVLWEATAKANAFFKNAFLEMMLAQKEVLSTLNDQEIVKLSELVQSRFLQRVNSNIYRSTIDVFYDTLEEQSTVYFQSPFGNLIPAETTIVYTPNLSSVNAYRVGGDMSGEERRYLDDYIADEFPSAIKLRSATMRYNCHSYA